jgi:hypothetical protein
MFMVRNRPAGYKVLCSADFVCVVKDRQIGMESWQLSAIGLLVIFLFGTPDPVGQRFFIHEVSRSHATTRHSP